MLVVALCLVDNFGKFDESATTLSVSFFLFVTTAACSTCMQPFSLTMHFMFELFVGNEVDGVTLQALTELMVSELIPVIKYSFLAHGVYSLSPGK